MLFRVLTYIFVVSSLLSYYFSEYYVAELAISFLPYFVLASGIMAMFWLFESVISWQNLKLKKYTKFLKIERIIFVLLGLFLFVLYGSTVKQFYYNNDRVQISNVVNNNAVSDPTDTVSILFANLLATNTEYDAIINLISENDPDVLMFVEFSDHHYEHLKEYLLKNYPYVNRTTRSKSLMVGSMVFSKYPINNIVENFEQGARRYGYFELLFDEEPYYFYLVHTSSPISLSFWKMRNRQLTTLLDDFSIHDEFRKHDNIVMVGDFNLSPWSEYYSDFVDRLSSDGFPSIENISSTQGLLFTWLGPSVITSFSPLQSHIDHIFTSRSNLVLFEKTLKMPGSDHKALLFNIKQIK